MAYAKSNAIHLHRVIEFGIEKYTGVSTVFKCYVKDITLLFTTQLHRNAMRGYAFCRTLYSYKRL